MIKAFVTGTAGQLGYDTALELVRRGYAVICADLLPGQNSPGGVPFVPLDITDGAAVKKTIRELKPDAVFHCAAWTAVDAAEEAANRQTVFAVNAKGTRNIAEACRETDAKMLYISTDYVFSGRGTDPWEADCLSFAPLNVYGQSKLMGEQAVRENLKETGEIQHGTDSCGA